VLPLAEQQSLFDETNGRSSAQKDIEDVARFFGSLGRLNKDEMSRVSTSSYATGKYIKLVPPNLKLKK
jgi:hypothetical protein